jgi:type I restriction enzyme S subunit
MVVNQKIKDSAIGKIPEDWCTTEFNRVFSNVVDNRGRTAPTSETGIPLIATNCIKEDGLYPVKEKLRYVSKETYDNWFRGHPQPNDIIIVNKGTPGMVCLVPDPVDFVIAQDMVAIRPDARKIYGRFLFAFMRSQVFKHEVDSLNVGTTIPHLKKTYFPLLVVPIPPRNEQEFIGDLYYFLSKKIEVNRKTSELLEAVGAALFRRWFVDFEFPNQEGKPYKSTGGKMQYNEDLQKEIPQGWTVGCIEDVADVIGGGTPSTKVQSYFTTDGIPWLTPKDLSGFEGKFIAKGATDLTSEGLKNSSAKVLPKGTILFTSRAPIGYLAIALNDIATNQGFKSLVPKGNMKSEYLYQYIKRITPYIQSISSGSTFGEVTGSTMKQIKILIPEMGLLQKFESFMEPINLRIINNSSNSQTLKEIRDLLLPKLMSGKIRVPINGANVEAPLCQK